MSAAADRHPLRRRLRRWACRMACLACPLLLADCRDRPPKPAATQVAGGDPRRAPALMREYGCVSCHVIPGIRGANSLVGPPLTRWAHRVYIAGLVPNTPENLVAWIVDPQRIHPRSAMPDMGVSVDEASHMAAYLYTLR